MKCPECVKENKKSFVNVGMSMTTAMYAAPFYDEEGKYHHHDPNTTSTEYSCSNGHRWTHKSTSTCWCGYGKA